MGLRVGGRGQIGLGGRRVFEGIRGGERWGGRDGDEKDKRQKRQEDNVGGDSEALSFDFRDAGVEMIDV